MSRFNKKQILVILGAAVLAVLLYLAPAVNPLSGEANTSGRSSGETEILVSEAAKALTPELLTEAQRLEEKASAGTPAERGAYLDSLSFFWKEINPAVAAHYAEKKSLMEDTPDSWNSAGEAYLRAARFAIQQEKSSLYQKAAAVFERTLAKSPAHIDAKVSLAVCYVEGTPDPMKGIMLLREVLQVDSNNIKAHLNLGYFSVKSGQYAKAIERFNKVLVLDPAYHEAHLYLGDAYENQGDLTNAIFHYEKYADHSDNPAIAEDIGKYIQKLKSKQTS